MFTEGIYSMCYDCLNKNKLIKILHRGQDLDYVIKKDLYKSFFWHTRNSKKWFHSHINIEKHV